MFISLTVRTRQSGDTFKLNGRDGYKKVNRLFIDCKVQQWVRDQMPIVLDKQQRIIAVGDLYQQQTIKQWIIISKKMNSVMHNDLKEVLLTEEDIQNICKELGAQLTKDYQGKPLVCVGILKGSAMFMSDLIKRIDTHLSIDFMDVSGYHGGTESTGEVQIIKDLGSSMKINVLIIEYLRDWYYT